MPEKTMSLERQILIRAERDAKMWEAMMARLPAYGADMLESKLALCVLSDAEAIVNIYEEWMEHDRE